MRCAQPANPPVPLLCGTGERMQLTDPRGEQPDAVMEEFTSGR